MLPKPDISTFGRYTYLLTEVFWGAIAYSLLWRAGALNRAAKTVLVLYPVAYVWDRYTLAVGVFDIPLRTGIELAGIPLEEHLFAVVVPSLVLGFHENLHDELGDRPGSAANAEAAGIEREVEAGGDATRD